MIRVTRHPRGPRLYVLGLRFHHGPLGLVGGAIALVLGQRTAAAILLAYGATDWRDFYWTDRHNH